MAANRKRTKAGDDDRARLDRLVKDIRRGRLTGQQEFQDIECLDPGALEIDKDQQSIVRFVRTAPFVNVPGVLGAGVGFREVGGKETGEISAVVLVRKKLPRSKLSKKHLIPDYVTHDGQRIRIDVQTGFDPFPKFCSAASGGAFPRATGSCSGSAVSLREAGRNPCAGGTLTGIFGNRALTCAHVSLGFGIEDFIGGLPLSLLWLLESPSGNDIVASGNIQTGQGLYRLFEVDTNWPILVPFPSPLAIAGAVGFLFVDGAAGDVNPLAIPPFVPPGSATAFGQPPFSFAGTPPPIAAPGSTRFGTNIRSARVARPGERCHKDGQTTGLTEGRVWLPFFQFYLPVPLGVVSTFVFFDLVLCRLVIAPGDSGAAGLSQDLSYLFQVSLGLPLPAGSAGGGPQPGVVCPVDNSDLVAFTIGTPYYLHELFLNINF